MCVCPFVPPVPARVTFCAHESKSVTPIDTVLRDTAPIQKYRVVGQVVAVWPQDVRLFSVRDPTTCVLRCSGASVFCMVVTAHACCDAAASTRTSSAWCLWTARPAQRVASCAVAYRCWCLAIMRCVRVWLCVRVCGRCGCVRVHAACSMGSRASRARAAVLYGQAKLLAVPPADLTTNEMTLRSVMNKVAAAMAGVQYRVGPTPCCPAQVSSLCNHYSFVDAAVFCVPVRRCSVAVCSPLTYAAVRWGLVIRTRLGTASATTCSTRSCPTLTQMQ